MAKQTLAELLSGTLSSVRLVFENAQRLHAPNGEGRTSSMAVRMVSSIIIFWWCQSGFTTKIHQASARLSNGTTIPPIARPTKARAITSQKYVGAAADRQPVIKRNMLANKKVCLWAEKSHFGPQISSTRSVSSNDKNRYKHISHKSHLIKLWEQVRFDIFFLAFLGLDF